MSRLLNHHQLVATLNGSPNFKETIASSGDSTRNASPLPPGALVLLQADADFYVAVGGADVTVTAANGLHVGAGEKFYALLKTSGTHVAVLPTGANVSVKVFVLE